MTFGANAKLEAGGNSASYAACSKPATSSACARADSTGFNTYTGAGARIAVGNNQEGGTIKMNQARAGHGGLVIDVGMGGSNSLIELTQGSVIGMPVTGVIIIQCGAGGTTIVNVISASAQFLCL